jgi:hypothetical protein
MKGVAVMSANWLANDNVPTKAIKVKAIYNVFKLREVAVALPLHSWENGDATLEIVRLRAASNRCRAAARAMTHPGMKARLTTRAIELALEAEALRHIIVPVRPT